MYIVAITGASGSILGIRLIEELLNARKDVSALVSETARDIIPHEIPNLKSFSSMKKIITGRGNASPDQLSEYGNSDLFAPPASGTTHTEAVIVIPCSMKTLGGIASGYSNSLILRSVDVALKESRKTIIVPRETPLNLIHIENLRTAKLAGASILPPVPGFYTKPKTVDDIIDFIIGKVLNLLDIDHTLFSSWGDNV